MSLQGQAILDRGFFNAQKSSFWDVYLQARPEYSDSFYNLIFDYHTTRGSNKWDLAHDVGTGPGNVAEVLAQRFSKVIASDVSSTHVEAAKERLETMGLLEEKIELYTAGGESISKLAEASEWNGKADLVTVAECISLMNIPAALKCFHELLGPGGTVAIWFYGRPILLAEDGESVHESAQSVYDKVATSAFGRIRPQKGTFWEMGGNMLFSWLQNVAFDDGWANIVRYKWNTDRPFMFFDQEGADFEFRDVSTADTTKETRYEQTDRTIFAKKRTAAWVRQFLRAHIPAFSQSDGLWQELEPMFEELERAMGGKDASLTVTWPVTLMIATRK